MIPVTDFPMASRGVTTVLDSEKVLGALNTILSFTRAKFYRELEPEDIALLTIALKVSVPMVMSFPSTQAMPFRTSPPALTISVKWPKKEGDDIVQLDGEAGPLPDETRELNDRIYRVCGWADKRPAA